ncbi:hypothetical protein B0T17DRAFT_501180 [Bombardia bombarda]|uniref:Uncharacterized protein n=1 Tax=Bombardia bombarda TaxID=252184 RepID=A0AA39TR28_9PEZI|nr:hypothetical protein B0T17DRAFT_501180 [Bombardia bombarda]
MGQNLSLSEPFADTSKAILSPTDATADTILGVIWICSIYGLASIVCAVHLIQRWSGPNGERGVNLFSVLAAFLVSTLWPVVLIYLFTIGRK